MGKAAFAKGESGNIYKPIHYATRRHGNFEVGMLNLDGSAGLTTRVMAADRAYGTLEVPDWRHAVCVATDANIAAGGIRKVTLASHTHYRVEARSQATGAAADYLIYTEDEA